MAYTHVSTLTSKNSNTYATKADWIAEHGNCGLTNPLVTSGDIVADGTNAVTRTLVYAERDDRQTHINARPGTLTFTATFVSEETT